MFCSNNYNKENLSRLIWLSHKLCGLTNEIRIYFPDYDSNKEFEVNGVKQTFKDEFLTTKISVHRYNNFDLISLKENQEITRLNHSSPNQLELVHSKIIPDDIEKILPFGDMLLPKLKSSILSSNDLKLFLDNKGIISNRKSKDELLPIFSCLLLSPSELDSLKSTYKEKEDKPKEIERKATANLGDRTLWEIINQNPILKNIQNVTLPKNCKFADRPLLERIDSDYNQVILKYRIEKENTNKDFLTGKSFHNAEMVISYSNNQIVILDSHTSSETYQLNKKIYERFSKYLKKDNLISEEFKSISFLDFDNNKRIQFLLSFLGLRQSTVFYIKEMTLEDMKFRADEMMNEMPDDLKSLQGRVSNLNLHGKQLDDTIYLSNEEYRKAELCEKLKFMISYKYLNRVGVCYLEVSFSGALGRSDYNDSELRISVTPSNNTFDNLFSSTKIKLLKEVNKLKESGYLRFKQETSKSNDSI